MVDVGQLVLGALVLWAPGLTWTWALAPGLDWAKFLAASVVVAITVQPALMYLLDLLVGVAVTPMNTVLLALLLASLGLFWALRTRLDHAWA